MEKITLTINTGNSAFDGENCEREVARILRDLADKIEGGREPESVMDYNGNKVGKVTFE